MYTVISSNPIGVSMYRRYNFRSIATMCKPNPSPFIKA